MSEVPTPSLFIATAAERQREFPDEYGRLVAATVQAETLAVEARLQQVRLTEGAGSTSVHQFVLDKNRALSGSFIDVEGLGLPPIDQSIGRVVGLVRSGDQTKPSSLEAAIMPPTKSSQWGSTPPSRVTTLFFEPGKSGEGQWVTGGSTRVSTPSTVRSELDYSADNKTAQLKLFVPRDDATPSETVLYRAVPTPAEAQQGFRLSREAQRQYAERKGRSSRWAGLVASLSGALALTGFVSHTIPEHPEITGGTQGIERFIDDVADRAGITSPEAVMRTKAAFVAAESGDVEVLQDMVKAGDYEVGWLGQDFRDDIAAADNIPDAVAAANQAFKSAGVRAEITAELATPKTAKGYSGDVAPTSYDTPLQETANNLADVEAIGAAICDLFNNLPKTVIKQDPPHIKIVQQAYVDDREVAGYYNPSTDEIFIAASQAGSAPKAIVNHEVAHDFDYRWSDMPSAQLDRLNPVPTDGSSVYIGGAAFDKIPNSPFVDRKKVSDRTYGRMDRGEAYAVAAESTLGNDAGVNEFDASPASMKRMAQIVQFEDFMPGFAANYMLKSQPTIYRAGVAQKMLQTTANIGQNFSGKREYFGEGFGMLLAGLVIVRNAWLQKRLRREPAKQK